MGNRTRLKHQMNGNSNLLQLLLLVLNYLLLAVLPSVKSQAELRYLLEEEKPVDTFIGNVVYDANMTSRYTPDVIRQLQYRFLTKPSISIAVDAKSGALRTSGRVDRELICQSSTVCDVTVDLVVQPMAYFQIIKVCCSDLIHCYIKLMV